MAQPYEITPDDVRGWKAEQRFFDFARSRRTYPSWWVSLEESTPRQDICGIDAVLKVKQTSTCKIVRIPIQVKSSQKGVESHLRRYKDHWQERVIFVVLPEWLRGVTWYDLFLSEVWRVVKGHYDYEDIFLEIEHEEVSPELCALLAAKREALRALTNEGESK